VREREPRSKGGVRLEPRKSKKPRVEVRLDRATRSLYAAKNNTRRRSRTNGSARGPAPTPRNAPAGVSRRGDIVGGGVARAGGSRRGLRGGRRTVGFSFAGNEASPKKQQDGIPAPVGGRLPRRARPSSERFEEPTSVYQEACVRKLRARPFRRCCDTGAASLMNAPCPRWRRHTKKNLRPFDSWQFIWDIFIRLNVRL
jgi:hypothetical protein